MPDTKSSAGTIDYLGCKSPASSKGASNASASQSATFATCIVFIDLTQLSEHLDVWFEAVCREWYPIQFAASRYLILICNVVALLVII